MGYLAQGNLNSTLETSASAETILPLDCSPTPQNMSPGKHTCPTLMCEIKFFQIKRCGSRNRARGWYLNIILCSYSCLLRSLFGPICSFSAMFICSDGKNFLNKYAADKTADAEFATIKNMHIISFVFSKLLLTVKLPLQTRNRFVI